MKGTSILISLILVLFMVVIACNTNTIAADKKSGLVLLIESKQGALTESQRVEIANELLKKIKALDGYIPSLTPNESQWLDEEWNSLTALPLEESNQKAFKLTSSPEYQTRELKRNIKNITIGLECVKNVVGVSIKKEMFCWASVSHDLTDKDSFNDSIRILVKSGKIFLSSAVSDRLGLIPYPAEDVWLPYNMYGRLIQSKIVLPHMQKMIQE